MLKTTKSTWSTSTSEMWTNFKSRIIKSTIFFQMFLVFCGRREIMHNSAISFYVNILLRLMIFLHVYVGLLLDNPEKFKQKKFKESSDIFVFYLTLTNSNLHGSNYFKYVKNVMNSFLSTYVNSMFMLNATKQYDNAAFSIA